MKNGLEAQEAMEHAKAIRDYCISIDCCADCIFYNSDRVGVDDCRLGRFAPYVWKLEEEERKK